MMCHKANFLPLIITFLSLFCAQTVNAAEGKEVEAITAQVESPLAVPLSQIISQFSRGNHVSVSAYFGDSAVQKKKIEDGESADIFITSQPELVEQMKIKGLIDIYSVRKFAVQNGKTYIVAVVLGENMNSARIFLEYLKSEAVHSIFEKNGMSAPS